MKNDSNLKKRNINHQKIDKSDSTKPDTAKNDSKIDKPALKYGPLPKFPQQGLITRLVMCLSVLFLVWFNSKSSQNTILASKKEILPHRGQSFECSASFLKEIQNFPNCVPKKCGRYVSDKLISPYEADLLLNLAKKGLFYSKTDGCVSILDLHSGALTYGENFINIYNLQSEIFTGEDIAIYKTIKTKIKHAIAQNFGISVDGLFLTHPTFFSRLNAKKPLTIHDEYWHPHVDKITYESFHFTSLLYLNTFEEDFSGGRLFFIDNNKNVTVEPRKARVLMFSSGEENLHFVERITSGIRYAITISFTCDENKAIFDPGKK